MKYSVVTAAALTAYVTQGYELLNDPVLTFDEAEAACQSTFGTNLASVHSDADQEAVHAACLQYDDSRNVCWIGFRRTASDKTVWEWTDGSVVDYGNDYSGGVFPWAGTNPSSLNEGCAEIYNNADGKWNDIRCTGSGQMAYAVCNSPPTKDCSTFDIDSFLLQCSDEFGANGQELDDVSSAVSGLETRMNGVDTSIAALTSADTALSGRIDAVDGRVDTVDGRAGALESALQTLSDRLDFCEERLSHFESSSSMQTIYDSGPDAELVPVQGSDPLFYVDIADNMIFSMDITINSFPSGWASIFHCGTTNFIRMPGIWIHASSDDEGGKGFHVAFSTKDYWNANADKITPQMTTRTNYKLEIKVTQSTIQIVVNGDIVIDEAHAEHALNTGEPCYVGDPWHSGADVVIKNLLVTGGEESVSSGQSVSGFAAVDATQLSNTIEIGNKDVLIYALVILNVACIVGCICCLFMKKQVVASKGYGVVEYDEDEKIIS